MTRREQIYSFLVEQTWLSDSHRKELSESRGFSFEAIEKHRFRSTGKELSNLESDLRNKFDVKDLIDAQVFIAQGDDGRLNPVFFEKRILIPYARLDGTIYHLRPHKQGLKGIPIEIYQEEYLKDEPTEIVLTEGEFKATAGWQLGFPTIAVPGISSFSDQHFPDLVALLNKYRVRKIIIIFDSEVKDDPAFPDRYKEDPANRFDTPLYAIYMAKRLEKENFEVRIGTLPDEWQKNGKIDIDGALAQKKTPEEFRQVIAQAKSHQDYLNGLDKTAQRIIKIKLARKYFHPRVIKNFGHYEAIKAGKDGEPDTHIVISNCILKIAAIYRTAEGVIRYVRLINELGEHSGTIPIKGSDMQTPDAFNTFCNDLGNFLWWGNKENLRDVWKQEFLNDDGQHITEMDHVGWIEEEKLWLFGNVAIDEKGKEYRPDKNGIFWINGSGIKAVALQVQGKSGLSEGIPLLYLNEFDPKELLDRLAYVIGREQALLCIGFVSALPFMEEIFDRYGCFPFLFFDGKRGSGKSSIAEWITSIGGIENPGRMAADTTPVAVQRYLAYYSCLPFFLDEYRNEKKVLDKNGLFRNVYNRHSAGKGIKASFGIREGKIRGTLIFAGEDVPTDNALRTRCIEIYVSENQRKGKPDQFNWMMANKIKFSRLLYDILKRKHEITDEYLKALNVDVEFLRSHKELDPRIAVNFAVITSALTAVLGIKDDQFTMWLINRATTAKQESEKSHAVSEFLEGLVYLKHTEQIDDTFYDYDQTENTIYLWYEGIYQKYAESAQRANRNLVFSKDGIRKYLKDEPYFRKAGVMTRLGKNQKRCMVFDYQTALEHLKDLVDDKVPAYLKDNMPGTAKPANGTTENNAPYQS